MLKVLLVDDEMIVRKGLKALVDWQKYEMEVVAEAPNGEKALEIIHQTPINLVITDIRMPIIDGLELTRRIKQDDPQCKVLLLTCYNDFEYVKEALEIGASGYLLKTDMEEEDGHLENTLRKIQLEVKKWKENQETVRELQRQAEQTVPLLREKWLKSLLDGGELGDYTEKAAKLGLAWLERPCLMLLAMNLEHFNLEEEPQFRSVSDTNHLAIQLGNGYLFAMIEKPYHISLQKQQQWEIEWINKFHARLFHKIVGSSQLYYCTSVGIHAIISNYYHLLNAGQYHSFYQSAKGVFDTRLMQLPSPYQEVEFKEWNELRQMVMIRNWEVVRELLAKGFDQITKQKPDVESVRRFVVEAILTITDGLQSNSHIITSVWGSNKFDFMEKAKAIQSFTELVDWIYVGIEQLEEERSTFIGGMSKVIGQALEYIEQHFHTDISLDDLSIHVGLSKSYFSSTFKKATGKNFVDYLLKLRIEKAKVLFRETDLKIYEVAEAVGFQDPKYFAKSFKRIEGISPNQYKVT